MLFQTAASALWAVEPEQFLYRLLFKRGNQPLLAEIADRNASFRTLSCYFCKRTASKKWYDPATPCLYIFLILPMHWCLEGQYKYTACPRQLSSVTLVVLRQL